MALYTTTRDAIINRTAGWQTTLAAELVANPPELSVRQRETLLALAMIPSGGAAGGVEVAAAADTITADENGKTFFLNLVGGFTLTLPAVAAGLRFTFIVKTAPTTAYILLAAAADTIVTTIFCEDGSDEGTNGNALADQVNFVASVALAGDRVDLECDGTLWYARCFGRNTGAITGTG